jgi:hydrogenase maturation factor
MVGEERKYAGSDRLRIAIAFSGHGRIGQAKRLTQYLDGHRDQDAAMHGLSALALEIVRDDCNVHTACGFSTPHGLRLTVALWSQARSQPEGYVLYTRSEDDARGRPAGRLYGTSRQISPIPGASLIDIPTAETFDPKRDPLRLVEAQRSSPDWPLCHVGGAIDVVTVDRSGVTVETLNTPWHDEKGFRLGSFGVLGWRRPIASRSSLQTGGSLGRSVRPSARTASRS